ncbi:hypothetical protein [Microvirga thermotolerans]|uniref:Uncharacterized protein n=1 Tax=Microvirga thermotolerans TaxID=2651334 RepID=A0A5P9K2I9_9HYPH|nr:hypothetical protein [Microvirga thermotolerans]QFU17910.1 hypothetical protein GDR74_17760 [Microvirga thermotolerans]
MTLAAVESSAGSHLVGMVFTRIGPRGLPALARYLEWDTFNADAPAPDRTCPPGFRRTSPARGAPVTVVSAGIGGGDLATRQVGANDAMAEAGRTADASAVRR